MSSQCDRLDIERLVRQLEVAEDERRKELEKLQEAERERSECERQKAECERKLNDLEYRVGNGRLRISEMERSISEQRRRLDLALSDYDC